MDLYYGSLNGNVINLSGDESSHLVNVRRAKAGDVCFVTDGRGSLIRARVTVPDSRNCVLDVEEITSQQQRVPYSLQLAVAPTKNIDRTEWILEKATEIGVDRITPLLCRHSERKEVRIDRLKKILVSAMKQSQKTFLPELDEMTPFSSYITEPFEGMKLICGMSAGIENHIRFKYRPGSSVRLLVGPEGDFHSDEYRAAIEAGYDAVSLGTARLRTETAAVFCCTAISLLNQ